MTETTEVPSVVSSTPTATERLKDKLKAKIEGRLALKSTPTAIDFMMILMVVLQMIMDGCKNTPQKAANQLKKMGPWTKATLYRGISSKEELLDIKDECFDCTVEVVLDTEVGILQQVFEEHNADKVDVDWSVF